MTTEIKIPSLGESISKATISKLIKPSGSFVKAGDELLEMETDKVNQVLYAPCTGIVSWQVKEGDEVQIHQVIGAVVPSDTPPPSQKKEPPPVTTKKQEPPTLAQKQEPPLVKQPSIPPSDTSLRQFADHFVQTLSDSSLPEKEPISHSEKGGGSRKKMSALRKAIAKRLVQVKNETAMLTTFNEIDLSKVIEIRNQEKENFKKKHGVKLGFMSFFVSAVVSALKTVPQINAMIDKEEIVTFSHYDIGVAVSTDKGLVVPVLRKCDELTFSEIEKQIEEYAKKAKEGSLKLGDLEGGNFTITNGGTFGSLLSTPILNPPQSAILGMHSIVKRAVVVEDQIVIRPMMYVALSYDHRIVDGKEAVLFLVHVKETLEDPSRLLLDL